jgi:uncharacterized protein YdhG (YjbR/CyaY superfamily)
MQSKATTVKQYLTELPADRRAAFTAVRDTILKNLDKDFEEGMSYGMIGYYVPHRLYPNGYHCDPRQPLPYAGLASQKNHMSLYAMCLYGDNAEEKRFRAEWAKTGKKLDMGKCCIRFKKLDDLPLNIIADLFRRVTAKAYIAQYEANLRMMGQRTTKGPPKKSAKSSAPKAKKAAAKKRAPSKKSK